MGAPGVDRKVISGLCCVDRMKASVVRPDGVGDGALGDPRDKRRGPCYSALGALQEVVISHDIFSADHHASLRDRALGFLLFHPVQLKVNLDTLHKINIKMRGPRGCMLSRNR